ncbi:YlaH-like family protein [Peribacillus kribbensis]|uniref:YlaH-like family protein n=1 Tax=Peribacillus kribbensis TaxID=356658 RepID=UPI00047BA74A|nr:YlaH-like family protein [Peribacillus kribbensis]
MDGMEHLSPATRLFVDLFGTKAGTDVLYFVIVILSVLVYNLGFAKKLPILKNIVIYVLLALGCLILTILAIQLPVVESLLVATFILGIYKIRLHQQKRNEAADSRS